MSTNSEPLPKLEAPRFPEGGKERIHDRDIEAPPPKEKDVRQPAVAAAPSIPAAPVTPATITPTVSAKAPAAVKPANLPADDKDLIEKEWVDRAKAIVAATKDNPHKQKHEISKVKAEYIQKRFNKTIRVDGTA